MEITTQNQLPHWPEISMALADPEVNGLLQGPQGLVSPGDPEGPDCSVHPSGLGSVHHKDQNKSSDF